MDHNISVEGIAYKLRPVGMADCQFIIDLRLQDKERNRYVNPISGELNDQEVWVQAYLEREGDYYFVIENVLTGQPEGLVGIYNINDKAAEWGRWVIQKGSLAALESLDLLCQAAFLELGLERLYCQTIQENEPVVSFHNATAEGLNDGFKGEVLLNGKTYPLVEHFITSSYYKSELCLELENKAQLAFKRNLRVYFGKMTFHHIGWATNNIKKEYNVLKLLGYRREGVEFTDGSQGIKGLFLIGADMPRIELLENLPGSRTLDAWVEQKIKLYHFAYSVDDIEASIEAFQQKRAKLISPLKQSAYFGTRICFLVLPNRFMIELIERGPS